jgi:hypothetical protein
MDFREHEIDFREADRRYAELTRQREAGNISDEEFDAQRQRLMVRDDEGRWWAKLGESGEWYYRESGTWVQGTPPGHQEVVPEPTTTSSPAQTSSSPPHSNGVENWENGRQRMPAWILVTGLGGIALVGIVLVIWVLVPYLQGEQSPSKQGGPMLSKQDEPASDGAAFDAVFIHRATSENISANSTYLDNPLTNDNPNVMLYVTPNWNPEGSAGTYNDHSIGVWYDSERQRWAIFNQDREPMPDGAAFNVAVLEE